MKRERSFAIISVLLGIALSVVMAEVAARFLAPSWLEARMNFLNPSSSDRGFGTDRDWKFESRDGDFLRFEPNTQFDVSHAEYHNVAHIDDLGTRRIYPNGAVKSGLIMVPFLGDSFTFGIGVEDNETFSSVLAKDFPRVRFLNVGVPGSALNSQLKWVRWRHGEWGRPSKYVFFFFMGNDFADILGSAEKKAWAVSETEPKNNTPDKANMPPTDWLQEFWVSVNHNIGHNQMLRHSYLIQWARSFVLQIHNAMRQRAGLQPDANPIFLIMDRTNVGYYAKVQSALEEQVEALAVLQKELNFTSLVIAIPDTYQLNHDDRIALATMYGYDQTNLNPLRPSQLLESTLREAGIRFFDAMDCLKSYPAPAGLYYKLDNHFTKVGHWQFAECIKPELEAFIRQ